MTTSGTTANNNNKCFNSTEIPEGTDFSPCICEWFSDAEPYVTCNQVNMTDVRDGLFTRLNRIYTGFLEPVFMNGDGIQIPSYFLGSAMRRINLLIFNCLYMENPLEVDELAFKLSDDVLTEIDNIKFINCNVSSLHFLLEIKLVYSVAFENTSNFHEFFASLPTEFEMKVFFLTKSFNLNLIDTVSKLPKVITGLKEFRVYENQELLDTTVDLLLDWLLSTKLRDELLWLYIHNNGLTRIPTQIGRFSLLQNFFFHYNVLSDGVVKKGDLKFSFLPLIISFHDCGIQKIETGAFQGLFITFLFNR